MGRHYEPTPGFEEVVLLEWARLKRVEAEAKKAAKCLLVIERLMVVYRLRRPKDPTLGVEE